MKNAAKIFTYGLAGTAIGIALGRLLISSPKRRVLQSQKVIDKAIDNTLNRDMAYLNDMKEMLASQIQKIDEKIAKLST